METLNMFLAEVKRFSQNNWWVYIIYILLLIYIKIFTDSEHIRAVLLTTSLHFIADIFIMMMFSAYSRKEYSEGAYFQIISMLIFLSTKIYTGIFNKEWHYLTADLIYALAAIKNYRLDVKRINITQINLTTMSILSVFIIFIVFIIPLKESGGPVLFSYAWQWVQIAGIFLFAIALSTTGNERLRYLLSVVALLAMISGSGWHIAESIVTNRINGISGLDLSYFLLPLTVLIFYIKRWSLF